MEYRHINNKTRGFIIHDTQKVPPLIVDKTCTKVKSNRHKS